MFLALAALLGYRQSFELKDTTSLWRLAKAWKFGKGGNFSITLDAISPSRPFFVGLLTASEANYILWYGSSQLVCSENVSSEFPLTRLFAKPDTFNGTLAEGGTYTLMWMACPQSEGDKATYTLSFRFVNPNTFLSLNEYPMVYGTPLVTVVLGGFLVLWFVNWLCNFSMKNKLHLLLTIAYVFTFIYYIVCCCTIVQQHKSDEPSNLPLACRVLRVFQETILLLVMSLAAEGWYIIRPDIKWREAVICAVLAVAVCVPAAVLDYADMSLVAAVFVLILFAVTGVLFYMNLLRHVGRARKQVMAHLVVIQEQGINPKTTPIYQKYTMFKSLSVTVLGYFLLLFTRSIFMSVWTFPEWIAELTYYILLSALMIVVGTFFKMKKETREGYFMIGEEGEPRVFTGNDIETLELTSFDGQTWSQDMALPGQPVIDFAAQPVPPPDDRDSRAAA